MKKKPAPVPPKAGDHSKAQYPKPGNSQGTPEANGKNR